MPRRKNSAEMLDVLRRLHQEERARRGSADGGDAQRGKKPRDGDVRGDARSDPQRDARSEGSAEAGPSRLERLFPRVLPGSPEGTSGAARQDMGAGAHPEAPVRLHREPPREARRVGGGAFRRAVLSVLAGRSAPAAAVISESAVSGVASARAVPLGEGGQAAVIESRHPLAVVPTPPRENPGIDRALAGAAGGTVAPPGAASFAPPFHSAAQSSGIGAPSEAAHGAVDGSTADGLAADDPDALDAAAGAGDPAAPDAAALSGAVGMDQEAAARAANSPAYGAPQFRNSGVRRPPLFGFAVEEGGLRVFLARAVQVLVGEGISGGFRKRVEMRLATLALYATVALAAMLAVAFILNREPSDPREKLVPQDDPPAGELPGGTVSGGSVLVQIDAIGPSRGAPEVRNIESAEAPPAALQEGAVPPAAVPAARPPAAKRQAPEAVTPQAAPKGTKGELITSEKAPPGFYVQVQAMVLPQHMDPMVKHFQLLGFSRIWARPGVRAPRKGKSDDAEDMFYMVRLGPYDSRDEAKAQMELFQRRIADKPLKLHPQPKLYWSPFIQQFP